MAEDSRKSMFGGLFGKKKAQNAETETEVKKEGGPPKWSMGVLNDKTTIEVPGSVLLLASDHNEPLGLRNAPARTSHSSLPIMGFPENIPMTPGGRNPLYPMPPTPPPADETKKTEDGKIILEPQPEDSENDPLNWPAWRRDTALLSLGIYCMIGGGITPILAAGFTDVAEEYHVTEERVALTTGMFMLGLGIGSVIASPTAILYGKRPVYLISALIFIVMSVWAAVSPNFASLCAARVFQGMAISPVECLPSATIAEIFFLHERAFRIGIYTLLLLGGKNLIPLVSAVIIESLDWRWVFWIVAMVVGLGFVLLFLFVPETFWDRTPVPKSRKPSRRPSFMRRLSSRYAIYPMRSHPVPPNSSGANAEPPRPTSPGARGRPKHHVGFVPDFEPISRHASSPTRSPYAESKIETPFAAPHKNLHVGFAGLSDAEKGNAEASENTSATLAEQSSNGEGSGQHKEATGTETEAGTGAGAGAEAEAASLQISESHPAVSREVTNEAISPTAPGPGTPDVPRRAPFNRTTSTQSDYFSRGHVNLNKETIPESSFTAPPKASAYTHNLRHKPARTFVQQLRPFHGRLHQDKWLKVMLRPFILYSYPSILWSAAVYACSVGWLIILSETVAIIYRDRDSYNFTALQCGLVYLSPFVGGVLGTAVAGKVSDVVVKTLARRNGGLYEPEFRLIMAGPIVITTVIGLMGFGWSAEEKDHWMVPTFFFGLISFGCSLGSTTSITFCVDSYRQYAGEALVTLNFAKNIFHGLVFSLFFTSWLDHDGAKMTFIWTGIIQLIVLMTSVPMYIYGKRARMWTVRRNMMERIKL